MIYLTSNHISHQSNFQHLIHTQHWHQHCQFAMQYYYIYMHTFLHFCAWFLGVEAFLFLQIKACPLPYFAKTLPTSPFDQQLLTQTDFLNYRNGIQLKTAVQTYLINGDRSHIDNIVRNQEIVWASLSAVIGVILLGILVWMIWKVGRLKTTDGQTFQSSKQHSLSTPLSSALACLSFPLLIFAIFLGYSFASAQSQFEIVTCQIAALWQQWRYGNDQQQWIGFQGIKQNIKLADIVVSGLNASNIINSTQIKLSYNALTISRQNIAALQSIKDTIQLQASISSTKNQWLYSLIQPGNNSVFTQLSTSLDEISALIFKINSIQQTLSQITSSSNATLDQFSLTLQLMEWQLNSMQLGYSQFQQDLGALLNMPILDLSFLLIPMLLILSFSSLFMLRMIQHYYEPLSLNMFSGLMVMTVVSALISLCLIVEIVGMKVATEGICLAVQDAQFQFRSAPMITTCIKDGTMDVPFITQPMAETYAFLSNLEQFGAISLSEIYKYVPLISNITSTLSQIKSGQLPSSFGNLSYQNNLLKNLNNFTMNNPFGQNCFMHHWELGVTGCRAGQDQYSDIQLILDAGGTVIPSHPTKSTCLIITPQLQQTLFLSLYSKFATLCPLTVSAIISASYPVFDAVAELNAQVNGIFTQILQITSGIQMISTYYIKYSQVRAQEIINATTVSNAQIANFRNDHNCSAFGGKIQKLISFFCVSFQSKLYQCFLGLVINLVTLACFLTLSFLYVSELKSMTKKQTSQDTPQHHSKNGLKHLQLHDTTLHESTTVTRRRASISTHKLLIDTTRSRQNCQVRQR